MLDSNNPLKTTENVWSGVENSDVANFIKNIITSKGSAGEQKEKFRALISGVPSPWARVLLTRKAVVSASAELQNTVLDECYKLLKTEWRGLIAAYALRPDRFEFSEPIALTGKNASENHGRMSVEYIYGQMLFEEVPLWVHKNEKVELRKDNPPCIQLLYYKVNNDVRRAVGATSPYTMFFSSVNYNMLDAQLEIPWIDNDGKFYDPVSCPKTTLEDLHRLCSLLEKIRSNINPKDGTPENSYLECLMAICKVPENKGYKVSTEELYQDISDWSTELGRWQDEIKARIESKGDKPNVNIPLVFSSIPQGPLSILLNSEYKFYYFNNALYTECKEGSSEIVSSNIFMDSEYIAAWVHKPEAGKDFRTLSSYYLITELSDKKNADNEIYALPVPFTQEALAIFSSNDELLGSIVGGGGAIRLTASVTVGANDVRYAEIDLLAKLGGENVYTSIGKKTYMLNVIPETEGKVFTWPDFTSEKWNKYYFYNEFPANATGVKMIPCFDNVDFMGIDKADADGYYLIKYPDNAGVGSHKYEIIGNKKPLKQISVVLDKNGKQFSLGTLVVKRRVGENLSKDIIPTETFDKLNEAQVGIDFGSTNTCAYYKVEEKVIPIPFTNRRKALVGFDAKAGSLAGKDELLFISNEGTICPNGQVKSWLHLHNPGYMNGKKSRELIGGVPVNERNILITGMNETNIYTNAGTLWYNMKWAADDTDKMQKQSFMQMLWIQICADMVCAKAKPKKLLWSYPGSMNNAFVGDLYNGLVTPISGVSYEIESHTEAEAVSAYAKKTLPGLNQNTLCLGIDIGGSTSDIHILQDNPVTHKTAMVAQSSVRLASGFFFKAINSSDLFRRSLCEFHKDFHKDNRDFYIANIDDIKSSDPDMYQRAPYYLNNIFDRLNTEEDCKRFYMHLRDANREVFAYPSFVTGVLMFYSGMLMKNVVDKYNIDLKKVRVKGYGNGGRLFDWLLDIFYETSRKYYSDCFAAGLGLQGVELEFDVSVKENKSEVAIGLVSDQFISLDGINGNQNRCDVVGEKGVVNTKNGESLSDTETIPEDLFDGAAYINIPEKLENFGTFIDIYTKFLVREALILTDVKQLVKGKENLQVIKYIQNDPEYIRCQKEYDPSNSERPIYRMPLFIAESLCYLKEVLLPEVSKQMNDE